MTYQPVVNNTSKEEFHDYTNECYITAATLFNPSKKPKRNTCPPSHLDGCTIAKAVEKAKISNA
jgi:hypothetical protein